MPETVLVTGGAGFIGSHLVDALVARGDRVRVFDNLEPQVHGPLREQECWPAYANAGAQYVLGDVRDRDVLARALEGTDVVYHLAAATGVGQSMYQISKYIDVNVQGTANLLDALANGPNGLRKLVLASSRAIYGEGAYRCERCGIVHPPVRSPAQLDAGQWEPQCPHCGGPIVAVPTPESLPPDPGSIYGVTKLAQEQLSRITGRAYGLDVTALRLFNVYGPRQSRSNPYTGIFTAFLGRLAAGQAPEVYEDGLMTRDFVHVSDVVKALVLALTAPAVAGAGGRAYNIGSGGAAAILDVARLICGATVTPQVSGAARVGDIRHCTADNAAAAAALGYMPAVDLAAGLAELAALRVDSHEDRAADLTVARRELAQAGLLR
jgi:dTDP-L-rhamnose 4-epimerase